MLYARAYMAGVAIPSVVVCLTGLAVGVYFPRIEPSVQRALMFPIASNPLAWGVGNAIWVALGPGRRLRIGWHGVLLSGLLVGVGTVAAPVFDFSFVTPVKALIVLPVIGGIYYVLWRYAVAFLNRGVGLGE